MYKRSFCYSLQILEINVYTQQQTEIKEVNQTLNRHMHEMGPQRPKHHIFDNFIFISKMPES